nr:MAG TPA: hypothetical protein [Caudoviricetes sp.]
MLKFLFFIFFYIVPLEGVTSGTSSETPINKGEKRYT